MFSKNSSAVNFELEIVFGNVKIPEPSTNLENPLKVT